VLYFGANLQGTAQYWHQRWRELQALFEFMVNEKKGLASYFMTGSCAEFYFSPLRRLLEQYILTANRLAQLVEQEVKGLTPDRTNTQGFKITEENKLPLQ